MKKNFGFIVLFLSFSLLTKGYFSQSQAVKSSSERIPFIIKSKIHLANLEGIIENLLFKRSHLSQDIETRISLSQALYEMAFYSGSLYQIQEAIDELSRAQKLAIGKSSYLKNIYLLKAKQEMSLHRFKDAQKSLNLATSYGATSIETAAIRADINWNQGHYKQAIQYYRNQAKIAPHMESIMRLAILEHQLGNFKEADLLYRKSISKFEGFNPIHYSWQKVQYGIHKLEIGEFNQAKILFLQALKISPDYILALEHLAETYHSLNMNSEAIKLYEKVVQLSDNPEFMGQLALLYQKDGNNKKAQKLLKETQKKYQKLLKDFPEA
ncbi:hypothetical protein MJH12_10090, partial [bacterium]|nr:hypothetical protein [bacterium]